VFAKEYFSPFNPTPLKGKPIIIVGPSGVGKNTLVKAVLKKYDGVFERKMSHTTRPKKSIEKTGNYYLLSREEFEKVRWNSKFIKPNIKYFVENKSW
jgi:guanylate kinase